MYQQMVPICTDRRVLLNSSRMAHTKPDRVLPLLRSEAIRGRDSPGQTCPSTTLFQNVSFTRMHVSASFLTTCSELHQDACLRIIPDYLLASMWSSRPPALQQKRISYRRLSDCQRAREKENDIEQDKQHERYGHVISRKMRSRAGT